MREFISLLGNKFFLYSLVAVILAGSFFISERNKNKFDKQMYDYKRQVQGQLSDKERELQQINKELGIARSKLVTQNELIGDLEKDKEELNKKFDDFVKKHNLLKFTKF